MQLFPQVVFIQVQNIPQCQDNFRYKSAFLKKEFEKFHVIWGRGIDEYDL